MVINNTIVELYYLTVQWHYLIIIIISSLMERKSESDVRRLQHSKNDVKWPPSWWIRHLFTMRYISSPEIPCLCINCRFLVCSYSEDLRWNKLWGHIYIGTLFFNQLMHFILYLFSEGVLFLLCLPVKLFFLLCYIKYLMVYKAFFFINFSCII